MAAEPECAIRIRDLSFRYGEGGFRLDLEALDIADGERIAVIGPNGTGKTTLLNLIAGVAVPERGTVQVAGADLTSLDDRRRRAHRIRTIGMVFQEFELISYLNVLDNVLLPYRLDSGLALTAEARAGGRDLVEQLGLGDKLRRPVAKLSQGERQRVAIGRALVTGAELILADEPTGNLDPRNKSRILDLLFEQVRARGATLVAVTHDHALLERFDRVVELDEGEAAA